VEVPGIGVRSDLVDLRLDDTGALEAPTDFARAGWFVDGPQPGQPGPSVIAGHVDSQDGPAVFFRLHELAEGDEVLVHRADGSTIRFAVTRVEQYAKDAFPTDAVYGPVPGPELRLITCGGEFDADRRSYRDNIVVYATALPG
jgi:sortase (surface protein transpeptidase)